MTRRLSTALREHGVTGRPASKLAATLWFLVVLLVWAFGCFEGDTCPKACRPFGVREVTWSSCVCNPPREVPAAKPDGGTR